LKAHYPLEYFTVALSLYSGDMDRTANLISEMNCFGIELKPIKFGHSNANYNIDRETNSIYKGVGAVKYCNEEVGNKLYEMKDQHFDSFLDLLDVFPGNSRQREILIKLSYFDSFGKTLKLLKLCDLHDMYNNKKIIKKDKFNLPLDLVQKYAKSETDKQYRFEPEAMNSLLRELEEMIPDTDIPLRTRLEAEAEYLGYLSYSDPSMKDIGFVMNVDCKYSPKITVFQMWNSETVVYKLQKKAYTNNPFDKGSFIQFHSEMRNKSRKDENGQWIKLDETEPWISNFLLRPELNV
jgi:DNA polymerase III alpha subunit